MTDPSPAISVLLPVHNGLPYLAETMISLLAQSFRDFEVVFIDDASTDSTPAFVQSLDDRRIRYIRVEKDDVVQGPDFVSYHRLVHALNLGLSQARGTLVARLDGDDVCRSDRLAVQFEAFRADPSLVLLGCDFDVIDRSGRWTGDNPYNVTNDDAARWVLLFDTPFLHPGIMFPLAAARGVGGYRTVTCCEDYDLYARMAPLGTFGLTARKLMSKRQHGENASVKFSAVGFANTAKLVAEYARANYTPNLAAAAAAALYAFYHNVPNASGADSASLHDTFDRLEAGFRARHGELSEEAVRAVRFIRELLGYRCFQMARSATSRPAEFIRWLRTASRFDPSRFSPPQLVGRSLGLIRNRPIDRRVIPVESNRRQVAPVPR